MIRSVAIFFLAGLLEIGGGFLVWQFFKENKPWYYALTGCSLLAFYGVVATWQTANFGRVYAAYGGIFIIMSLLWAWKFENFKPDKYDVIGASIALFGALVIVYAPRINR